MAQRLSDPDLPLSASSLSIKARSDLGARHLAISFSLDLTSVAELGLLDEEAASAVAATADGTLNGLFSLGRCAADAAYVSRYSYYLKNRARNAYEYSRCSFPSRHAPCMFRLRLVATLTFMPASITP